MSFINLFLIYFDAIFAFSGAPLSVPPYPQYMCQPTVIPSFSVCNCVGGFYAQYFVRNESSRHSSIRRKFPGIVLLSPGKHGRIVLLSCSLVAEF